MENTTNHCMMCQDPDSADDMVQCDTCQLWAHFRCAGVSGEIKNNPWSCEKCCNLLTVSKPSKHKGKKAGSKGDTGSVHSAASEKESGSVCSSVLALEISLRELKEEQRLKEKALENERIVREKRMEMEQVLLEKRMQQERELREKELQHNREMKRRTLEQERQILEMQLAEEAEFLNKRQGLRDSFQEKIDTMKKLVDEHESICGENDEGKAMNSPTDKIQKWLQGEQQTTVGDPRAYPKRIAKSSAEKRPNRIRSTLRKFAEEEEIDSANENTDEESQDKEDCNEVEETGFNNEDWELVKRLLKNRRQNGPGYKTAGPTKEQLAARQAVSKHLPVFRGEPEIWPIFISSFEYTTEACGFSNLDNLKRLQDCLQGEALEAVRSRLVLPESVPDVIKDLPDLFGKPEKLLKSLLMKVRKAQSPRVDRLNTFIYFGITVKQLCDHLEAAGLEDHLNNPMLVQELVDKLPSSYKLDWVRFKRHGGGSALRVFTDFMNNIVSDVSEVCDISTIELNESARVGNGKPKRKEFVHVHTNPQKQERICNGRKSQ